jgi:hypothetical protein
LAHWRRGPRLAMIRVISDFSTIKKDGTKIIFWMSRIFDRDIALI